MSVKSKIASCMSVLAVSLAAVCLAQEPQARPAYTGPFPLRDGDTWVLLGDSVTARHQHVNYIEAFCYARFPAMTFHFRNSGVGGDTVPKAMARFDWDVAPWKPTVVSVELGLNDGFYTEYRTNMIALVERIKGVGARPVLFTPHPLIDGVYLASIKKGGMKDKVEGNSTALGVIATEQGLAFADQFHTLVDVWAKNFPVQSVHYAASVARDVLEKQKELPGREHLQQWLDIWAKSEMAASGTDLGIDYVHPGPAGNLTMEAALLKGLNAPGLVSKATLEATGKVGELIQCQVNNVVVEKNGGLSFDRLDTCLPMPIPDNARGGLIVYPAVADLSQWILTVKGLKGGSYRVDIDGTNVTTVATRDLEKGWNMGLLDKGPVANQCQQILSLVGAKESLVTAWRQNYGILIKNPAATFAASATPEKLSQQALEADAKIRAAAQPKSHRFTLIPVEQQ